MPGDEEFVAFVASRGAALRRTAFLMTGDWHGAEDLAQTAMAKLYVAWPRVRLDGAEAYARTVLARTIVDARRRFWQRERPTDALPELPLPRDATEAADARLDLGRALALLPAGQRVVIVLRFWEDLSVEQVSGMLALSPGTVKSRTSRALDTLRAAVGPSLTLAEEVS